MMKKSISVLLVLCLLCSVFMLAGCQKNDNNQNSNDNSKSNKNDVQNSKDNNKNKENDENNDNKEEVKEKVNLIWYVRGDEPKRAEEVEAAANEIVEAEINANVDFRFISPGDYNNKMQVIMSASEEFDLCYTASWANNYVANSTNGAYLEMDDMLANYPDLQALFKDEVWDGCRVGGKLYGVPHLQVMYNQPGMWFLKEYVEKYDIDLDSIKSYDDLTPIFQTIKDNEPNVIPFRGNIDPHAWREFEPKLEGHFAVNENWEVYDLLPSSKEYFETTREWYQKGFLPQDVATLKDENTLIREGKLFSRYSRQKPGNDIELQNKYGQEFISVPINVGVTEKGGVISSLTAISITSKNPERAMDAIDLMNKNADFLNTMVFGVEGTDYKKLSDTRIEPIPDTYQFMAWQLGNQFNAYLIPGQLDTVWEETKKGNDEAIVDPLLTFDFDRTSVESELANLSALWQEYKLILNNGLDDVDSAMKAYEDKRMAAGQEKVIAELQKQIDEWRK